MTQSYSVNGVRMDLDTSEAIQGQMAIGKYEPTESEWVRRHLRPGSVFVDVGANFGWFTTLALSCVGSSGHVFAFEPSPVAFATLQRALGSHGNVTLINAAVGREPGEITLYLPNSGPVHSPSVFESPGDFRGSARADGLARSVRGPERCAHHRYGQDRRRGFGTRRRRRHEGPDCRRPGASGALRVQFGLAEASTTLPWTSLRISFEELGFDMEVEHAVADWAYQRWRAVPRPGRAVPSSQRAARQPLSRQGSCAVQARDQKLARHPGSIVSVSSRA